MSQKKEILHYLENGHQLTQRRATQLGFGTRLAARIAELKQDGHPILKETVTVPTKRDTMAKIARYSIGGKKVRLTRNVMADLITGRKRLPGRSEPK
jgi:hypothetical protein